MSRAIKYRDREILGFIGRQRFPVTTGDIARHFGMRSRSSARYHVLKLQAAGYLRRTPGKRATIRLTAAGRQVLAAGAEQP